MLYLVVSGGYMKVGYTANLQTLQSRLRQYKTHNPNITVVGVCRGSKALEKYFHKKCRLLKGSEFAIFDPKVVAEFMSQPTFVYGIPHQCITPFSNKKTRRICRVKKK